MTRDEIDTWLVRFATTWPRPELGPAAVQLWRHDLSNLDSGPAFRALETLRSAEQYQPTLAQFRAVLRSQSIPEVKALPERSKDDQRLINWAGIAATREALRTARLRA